MEVCFPSSISVQHGDNFLSVIIVKGFHFLQTFAKYYISKKGSFHKLYFLYKTYFSFAARNRGIAIPADLESQIQALFTRSQLVMKHTRHWLSHGKGRRDSIMNLSRDYRSIIEGLQVRVLYLCYLPTPERKRATEITTHERHLIT